ncbi:hypothetical protein LguiB_019602 [Lonicera macranthoides]
MSSRHGPPKHQNQYAWKPKAGVKINETEVGGRFRPFSEVTGVCLRCKEQIEWKRKYGKYKQLTEPAKCQRCTKRNVRQAYHNLCTACAKEQKVCAKCSCRVERIIGRDITEVETEQKKLEEAINNARERERRTLLRALFPGTVGPWRQAFDGLSLNWFSESQFYVWAMSVCNVEAFNSPLLNDTLQFCPKLTMNKGKSQTSGETPSDNEDKAANLVTAGALEESAEAGRDDEDDDDSNDEGQNP